MRGKITIAAFFLLLFIFLISLLSIKNDTLTFDEPAHIGAGYSYLIKNDYRLNPEHPPLAKDLAAFPLLFLKLNFPENHYSWQQKEPAAWWFQFDFGKELIYRANLKATEKIIFFSKTAMVLLLVFTGLYLFFWTKKIWGEKTALFTLFFFSFSPTFLAHGRLVTTDVAASFGVILSTSFYLSFLKNIHSKKNLFLAAIGLGLSLLMKFSLILLLPFFFLITILFFIFKKSEKVSLPRLILNFILINLIAFIFVIFPVYYFHIFNYPKERQIRDIAFNLENLKFPSFLKEFNLFLAKNDFLRPWAQYLLGLLMAVHRTGSGNTMFFLGEISTQGWPYYFPIVFLLKEPLPLHILIAFSFFYLILKVKRIWEKTGFSTIKKMLSLHFDLLAIVVFVIIYWLVSLNSKLNLGVRHLLPSFPFLYIIVSFAIVKMLKEPYLKFKIFFLSFLLLWQAVSLIKIYPYFLSYFNELIGGPKNGYLYTTDSNLDWGQDLKRLAQWLEKKKINKIYIDYFGGGDLDFYLKGKYLPWNGRDDPRNLKKPSFLAVSVNSLQSGRAIPGKNFDQTTDFYYWLYRYEPAVAQIGYSIFVYFIND